MNLDKEIETFEKQANDYKKELYANLKPAEKMLIARHPNRPNFFDYVNLLTDDFIEMHGDRAGMDDRAIIGGVAKIGGKNVMLIGTQKGKTTKENLEYNFGMPQPQGYRKALRLFYHANKFNMPIITLIDTPGAYPGISAEETGQGGAIAVNLREMAKLNVPIVAVITGEGCSGGALGLAVADKVLILEHAYYTVISPEGCASILWRDASMTSTAAEALKITGPDLMKFKIVDEIVKEPVGGAHCNHEQMATELKKSIMSSIEALSKIDSAKLKDDRYNKYRNLGVVEQ
jgi:acetyl-CoA carboxylase carboxyl transferase subunit alpha